MKVPTNAENPTWDEVENVSLWRMMTADKATKKERIRRRNAAVRHHMSRINRKTEAWGQRKQDETYATGLAEAQRRLATGRWTQDQFNTWLHAADRAMAEHRIEVQS